MNRTIKRLVVVAVAFAAGAAAMHAYHESTLKTRIFGPSLKHGIVQPAHAVNELLASGDVNEQRSAVMYLLDHKSADTLPTLERALPGADPSVRPFLEVGLGRFNLRDYVAAPAPFTRISALHASRYWVDANKVAAILPFLNDSDPTVVGQAVFELGEIGDPSVLPLLQQPRFDQTHFIRAVRQKLADLLSRQQVEKGV